MNLPKINDEAHSGLRFQIANALKFVERGHPMFVEWRIDNWSKHVDDAWKRNEFFDQLTRVETWEKAPSEKLEAVILPGTFHNISVGRTLLRNGWCIPHDGEYWVPNMRKYSISEKGKAALQEWKTDWAKFSLFEKIRMMTFE